MAPAWARHRAPRLDGRGKAARSAVTAATVIRCRIRTRCCLMLYAGEPSLRHRSWPRSRRPLTLLVAVPFIGYVRGSSVYYAASAHELPTHRDKYALLLRGCVPGADFHDHRRQNSDCWSADARLSGQATFHFRQAGCVPSALCPICSSTAKMTACRCLSAGDAATIRKRRSSKVSCFHSISL